MSSVLSSGGYQVFNYINKPDLSTKELIEIIEKTLDVSVPSFNIPYWLGVYFATPQSNVAR